MPLKARNFYETMYLHNQVTQTFLIFADAGPMARAATSKQGVFCNQNFCQRLLKSLSTFLNSFFHSFREIDINHIVLSICYGHVYKFREIWWEDFDVSGYNHVFFFTWLAGTPSL